jgi:hypothetical protein
MKNRYLESFTIDTLRVLGIVCIILAHVNPHGIVFQLRNFDVILLLLISGVTFSMKYGNTVISPFPYWKHRIARLLIPTYTFLFIFFVFAYATHALLHINLLPHDKRCIIKSFMLAREGGIAYMWIIAVFLIAGIITPLIARLNHAIKRDRFYFSIIYSILLLHEMLLMVLPRGVDAQHFLSKNYLFYIVPYACIFSIGVRLRKLSLHSILLTAVVTAILFGLAALMLSIKQEHFVFTQEYKYPPRLYYIFYGLSVSLFVKVFISKLMKYLINFKNIIIFVSRSSLWIYLWHVLLLYIFKSVFTNLMMQLAAIISLSMAVTFLQKKIVKRFMLAGKFGPRTSAFLETAFL